MTNHKTEFTFYGDLLGVSGFYKLSPKTAKAKLDTFYNTVYYSLGQHCEDTPSDRVWMFSDSLLFYGEDAIVALSKLHEIYTKLLHAGILLRGAMVKGRLSFEPRAELENFSKQLPDDDSLARAVGLERSQKGARLIIENELARTLLLRYPEWLTHEGYIRHCCDGIYGIPSVDMLRRICPTPDLNNYECLYFWINSTQLEHLEVDYQRIKKELAEIKNMLQDDIATHYKETIELLNRCRSRQTFTKAKMLLDD